MLFSFKLQEVGCESVLSTEDSEWGEADGIRVYFVVLTTGGFHQVLVSGRELPPGDAVDNYYFVPQKALDLGQFAPQNADGWTLTPSQGLADGDSVMITVIGINEGLPYVAGGGGLGGTEKANLKVFEEIGQKGAEAAGEKLARKGGEAAGAALFSVAWSSIEDLIKELNESPECRGVAFCYPVEVSLKRLLLEHLRAPSTTHRIDSSSPTTGLGLIAAAQHPPGCGASRYWIELGIDRIDSLGIAVDDAAGASREGEHIVRPVKLLPCTPPGGAEMHTWLRYTDRTITLTPSHSLPSLKPTWYVDDIEIQRDEQELSLTLPVTDHAGGPETERPVVVRCEQIRHDGKEVLVLHTRGEDGNFSLNVSLRMNFEGVDPPPPESWVEFRSQVVQVSGSESEGDEAWRKYFACVVQTEVKEEQEKATSTTKKPGKLDPLEIANLTKKVRIQVLAGLEKSVSDSS